MLVRGGLWNGVLADDPPGTVAKGTGERFGPGAFLGAFIGALLGAFIADRLDSDFAFEWGIAGAIVGGEIGLPWHGRGQGFNSPQHHQVRGHFDLLRWIFPGHGESVGE